MPEMLFLPLGSSAVFSDLPFLSLSLLLSSFFLSPPSRINRTQRWVEWVGASGGSIFDLGCTLPVHDSLKSRAVFLLQPPWVCRRSYNMEIIWLNSACAQVIEPSIGGFGNIQNTYILQ
jgi:hypothetical protein